jgi:hypothetical protein
LRKEAKQTAKAMKKSYNASADVKPGANTRARATNKASDAQIGQLIGALVQGRRYDDKTGKQVKGKKK